MQRQGTEVITGTNLQLLLEMVRARWPDQRSISLAGAGVRQRRGLTNRDELGRCREEVPVEEGI